MVKTKSPKWGNIIASSLSSLPESAELVSCSQRLRPDPARVNRIVIESAAELSHLALLGRIDEFSDRLAAWCDHPGQWQPARAEQFFLRRVRERLDKIRARITAPLVVATFGGTGTGKSSLVNALVGDDVTRSGRQRPTTTRPILIVGPETDLAAISFLTVEDCEVVQASGPLLDQMVLLDCPDPNTSETDGEGTNLDRLRRMLPHVDVLLCTATQETYASSRVLEELAGAAEGCRLVFVQTRAHLDSDIRDDWRDRLGDSFEVPEMFFVDSVEALDDHRNGRPPTGEFARLTHLLTHELAATERIRVRWANVGDLASRAMGDASARLERAVPRLTQLEDKLNRQRDEVARSWLSEIERELGANRGLWERRLLAGVSRQWGATPFSLLMKFTGGLGGWFASLALARSRSVAQMALVGATELARLAAREAGDLGAEERFLLAATGPIDEARLKGLRLVALGYARDAGLELPPQREALTLAESRPVVMGELASRTRSAIEGAVDETARSSGRLTRFACECAIIGYVLYALAKPAKNFFYEHPWLDAPLLSSDYYIHAGLFFVLLTGLLVVWMTSVLRRALRRRLPAALRRLIETGREPLHADLDAARSAAQEQVDALLKLRGMADALRPVATSAGRLGRRIAQTVP